MKIANRILYLGKIPLIEKHYQRQLTVSASLVHAKNIRGCTLDVIALVKSENTVGYTSNIWGQNTTTKQLFWKLRAYLCQL